jgi:hypothetical protein
MDIKELKVGLPVYSLEYAAQIVQALAIAQKNGQIAGPTDLEKLIAAGIETAFEDLLEKLDEPSKIELG